MTEHDKDILKVTHYLMEESPKGTTIEMNLSIGSFKIKI